MPPLDEVPFARLGFDESDINSEDEAEDGMDEAQKIWRDMKDRKYGSGGGGSTGWMKFFTDVNRNGGARGGGTSSSAGSKNLVRLRDVI